MFCDGWQLELTGCFAFPLRHPREARGSCLLSTIARKFTERFPNSAAFKEKQGRAQDAVPKSQSSQETGR